MDSSANSIPFYDVIVIGAGPAGAEAALASAAGGSHTLCLSISLDTVGYPPGSPVMAEDAQDVRGRLFEEMEIIGGTLPALVRLKGVAAEPAHADALPGRLVIDRRGLGLAYKEAIESTAGLELRQALVTSVEPRVANGGAAWRITGKLGEKFDAASVVIAAGTFLKGVVDDAGDLIPGGRRGEIPANALALWLQNLGIEMVEVKATSDPRLDLKRRGPNLSRDAAAGSASKPGSEKVIVAKNDNDFITDGFQLGELLYRGSRPEGNRLTQLSTIRKETGPPGAWMTRASYSVRHLVLRAGQVDGNLESPRHPGLFFAGRAAGCCNYVEAALLGTMAGICASARAQGRVHLTTQTKNGVVLCAAIASQENRPVTVCRPSSRNT